MRIVVDQANACGTQPRQRGLQIGGDQRHRERTFAELGQPGRQWRSLARQRCQQLDHARAEQEARRRQGTAGHWMYRQAVSRKSSQALPGQGRLVDVMDH